MFCNRCGTQLQPNFQLCPRCGKRIGDPIGSVAQSRLERHLRTLASLWMVIGGLFLLPAFGLMIFGRSAHFVLHHQEPLQGFLPVFLYVACGTLVILGAGGICVGLGLMQHAPWARVTAIVLGVLALFHPPLGTALGVYTLWVLLADQHGDAYSGLTQSS